MRQLSSALILAVPCVLSGCLMGPNYKRPAVTTPPAYRDVEAVSKSANTAQPSLGDLKWSEIFQDEQLKSLITEALTNNYDIRIAAQRVLEQQELRALDAQLQITHSTLAARQESLRLVSLRESTGATTMADVYQAQQLLFAAASEQPRLEREIREQENGLSLLLGRNPGSVLRGRENKEQPHPEEVPAGLPSQLLERRPDIQQAEAELIAANAQIGVARAQFFPQITLTGVGGTTTSQLNKLFSSASSYFVGSGLVSVPLFTGGRLTNNLKKAQETQKEIVLSYQKTIAAAFRDVSNALIAYQKSRDDRIAQEKQTEAAAGAVRLARIRYENGRASYLEVLTNDTNLFSAELNLAAVQEQEALSLVQLYDALGGGWQ